MEKQETIISKFKTLWKYYLLQCFLVTVVLFILVLVLGEDKSLVISAMGATAFIVFAMPKAASAKTRNVIGGHLVGLASGAIFYLTTLPYLVEYPLAAGLAFFLNGSLGCGTPPRCRHSSGCGNKRSLFQRLYHHNVKCGNLITMPLLSKRLLEGFGMSSA